MKILLLLAATTLIVMAAFAQSPGRITGKIIDGGAKTIESATITLHRAADSTVIKITVANKEGEYEFENIASGRYFISVTAIGHAVGYSGEIDIKQDNRGASIPTIDLVPQSKYLSGVTVTGRKPFIEQKIDRMVVNVDAAVTNVGATALEVLEKSPGITVDKDGNISLKGKQSVQVYIDGKPSYLGGQDLVNLLSSMNATQLDQVEIMTNPPARYEASGNSGIINIKTKKNKQKGFNGSATTGYSQGKYWGVNESLNLNYRKDKVNLFMNYNYNNLHRFNKLNIHRTYLHADKTVDALFDQTSFMPRSRTNNNLKLGMDLFINDKTTIGILASGFINPEKENNYNTSYLKDGSGNLDSTVYSTTVFNGKWKNGSANINFRHLFDTTGKELTADLDYSVYSAFSDNYFVNTSYYPDGNQKGRTELTGELPVDINIYSAKIDYTHPVKNEWKLESGLKTSYVKTDNAANYFNLENDLWIPDYDKTNRFLYKENVNSAYVNLSVQLKKWAIQTGLRFENTNYKGRQLGNPQKPDSSFNNDYNSLFPTVYINYTPSEKNQFGFNIGRRIDRPAYQDLNPFLYFLDNYTYASGNPFLRPQYTLNLELTHTFKGILTTTLNYSRTKNFMTETFEQLDYATIVKQGNIGERHNAGLSVSAQLKVTKWWTAILYGNYNYNLFEGQLYGETINIDESNIVLNVNNQLKFEKGWGAELSGFYRTKGVEGQILIQPLGQMSAGITKQVLKGKGSIRLSARDIFYTNRVKGNINFQRTRAYFESFRDSRVASISFTYRFGKPPKNQVGERKRGGASEEQNRVKGSEN